MPIQAFRPERFRTYGMLMKTIVVYAIVDSGYQNAKLLGDKPYHYYRFGLTRGGIKKHPDRYRSPKARDYLPIHMKPEDVRKEEIEQD